jgi:protein-ribulosamine 3-kinase
MIPDSIRNFLSDRLNLDVSEVNRLSGGSINEAYRLESVQNSFFLKLNRSAPADFFSKEAMGLGLLRSATSDIIIPEVYAAESPAENRPGFLLMEYIEEGRDGDSFGFGQNLAKLHQSTADKYGLDTDNYIGSLPQSNRQHDNWVGFFAEERIEPQIKLAVDSGKLSTAIRKPWKRLSARLNEIFPPAKPSLLHGDLWGGNYLFSSMGKAVLIDPAPYYGHPEMDLAFSRMFGGFSAGFYEGYESETALEPGFSERIPIYNLYPLLVHVNLFGGHYISQFNSILRNY